jgi:hypothetical protein
MEYIGVLKDPRSKREKKKDFKYDGLLAFGLPVWEEKNKFKSYLIKNQDGSSSCVAQATSKLLGIHEVVEGREYKNLSPKFIYTRRSNYPSGGMWFHNALEIACRDGACKEDLLPSDMTGESFMNDKSQESPECSVDALVYKAKNYIALPINIDTIAEVMSQGYGVLLGFRFDYDEWTTKPFLKQGSKLACHHGVAGIDFGLRGGEKVIAIDDSWGPGYGKGGQRFITEEFLNKRCTYAGYVVSLIYEPLDEKFHYQWLKNMRFYGIFNSKKDVLALQRALQIKGYFPKNAKVDGIFGGITLKSVKAFQRSYGLKDDGICGPLTREILNTQFK